MRPAPGLGGSGAPTIAVLLLLGLAARRPGPRGVQAHPQRLRGGRRQRREADRRRAPRARPAAGHGHQPLRVLQPHPARRLAARWWSPTGYQGDTLATQLDGDLQVLHISGTYYEWLKSARLHDDTRENVFAEPLSVRGNVENGYGVFAGYSSRTFEFDLE